ncbi:hypothetical protein JKP88DRAFT_250141 [Tribonema minus]|uniref:Uncharacterized protein n=1 Tax=Tribonema minus TaxID=303371 RepID=A0A835YJ21_9STRA|nr:hypothetical protein JKP88DRAFT_250141 [Tribonema minus]
MAESNGTEVPKAKQSPPRPIHSAGYEAVLGLGIRRSAARFSAATYGLPRQRPAAAAGAAAPRDPVASAAVDPSLDANALADRLQKLESVVSQAAAANGAQEQGNQQRQQHSQQQEQQRKRVVEDADDGDGGAALRESLLMEEHNLELGHRDMLLRRARDSIAALQAEVEALRSADAARRELSAELGDVRADRDALAGDLRQLRRAAKEAAREAEAQAARLRSERDEVLSDVAQARALAEDAQRRADAQAAAARAAREAQEASAAALAAAQSQAARLREVEGALRESQTELRKTSSALESARMDAAAAKAEAQRATRLVQAERKSCADAAAERDAIAMEHADVLRALEEASAECGALRHARAGLEGALQRCAAEADKELAELREVLDGERHRAGKAMEAVSAHEARASQLNHRLKALQAELDQAQRDRAEGNAREAALRDATLESLTYSLMKYSVSKSLTHSLTHSLVYFAQRERTEGDAREAALRDASQATASECAELQRRCASADRSAAKAASEAETARQRVAVLEAEVAALRDELQRSTQLRDAAEQQRRTSEGRRDDAEADARRATSEAARLLALCQQYHALLPRALEHVDAACAEHLGGATGAANGGSAPHAGIGALLAPAYSAATAVPAEVSAAAAAALGRTSRLLESVLRQLSAATQLRRQFGAASAQVHADVRRAFDELRQRCDAQHGRLKAAEQALAVLRGEMRFAGKRAALAEREAAHSRLDAIREEARALQGRLITTEHHQGELALLRTRAHHASQQAEEVKSRMAAEIDELRERLAQAQELTDAAVLQVEQRLAQEVCARESCEAECQELAAELDAAQQRSDAAEHRADAAEREAKEATAAAAAAATDAAVAREVAQTRELLRSSREELATDRRLALGEAFSDSQQQRAPSSSIAGAAAAADQSSRLASLVLELKGLLLDCNAQLALQAQGLGLEYQRMRRSIDGGGSVAALRTSSQFYNASTPTADLSASYDRDDAAARSFLGLSQAEQQRSSQHGTARPTSAAAAASAAQNGAPGPMQHASTPRRPRPSRASTPLRASVDAFTPLTDRTAASRSSRGGGAAAAAAGRSLSPSRVYGLDPRARQPRSIFGRTGGSSGGGGRIGELFAPPPPPVSPAASARSAAAAESVTRGSPWALRGAASDATSAWRPR